jgi:hypothetical protein
MNKMNGVHPDRARTDDASRLVGCGCAVLLVALGVAALGIALAVAISVLR